MIRMLREYAFNSLLGQRKKKENGKLCLLLIAKDASEHMQEQKSARNICPLIAKSGDVSSCPYNERCRFSHDLEAFKDQVVKMWTNVLQF